MESHIVTGLFLLAGAVLGGLAGISFFAILGYGFGILLDLNPNNRWFPIGLRVTAIVGAILGFLLVSVPSFALAGNGGTEGAPMTRSAFGGSQTSWEMSPEWLNLCCLLLGILVGLLLRTFILRMNEPSK